MPTMFSSRVNASRGRLAWIVPIEPSWPVFMACSMSMASPPRTSPRMIRSGRMRSAFFTKSRMVISPWPSRFGGRVSRRTTCGCCSCSSAASSMVTTRSPLSISCESAFNSVVLPEPVPPEIRIEQRQRAAMRSTCAICGDMLPWASMISRVILCLANLRTEIDGPSIASGGMMMLTRLPSSRRASQIGEASSTRRPTRVTIREAMFITCRLSRNSTEVSSSLPPRSTKTCLGPLTIMSVMPSSANSGSSGPSPSMSLSSAATSLRCSARLSCSLSSANSSMTRSESSLPKASRGNWAAALTSIRCISFG